MNYKEEYKMWVDNLLSLKDKEELEALSLEEIETRFSQDVIFGTAGARELMQLGPNRINLFTIRKITYAFAEYLLEQYGAKNLKNYGVVIFHDARHNSVEYAEEICRVFSHFWIKSYIVEKNNLGSTPFTSYCIRQLQAYGGVMVTASHNPKEYNGYKAYNLHGAQLLPCETDEIRKRMMKIKNIFKLEIKVNRDCIFEINDDFLHNYMEAVKNTQFEPTLSRIAKVVFTPQQGVSGDHVLRILKESGYEAIPVKEQINPDPDFSHTKNPNPEVLESWDLARVYLSENNADVAIAVDPDGDRLGVMVNHEGQHVLLDGNQTGAIFLDYILKQLKKRNQIPENPYVFSTFVCSHLTDLIAKNYGCSVWKTPTGIKWMANYLSTKEFEHHKKNFVYGFESSFGYLLKPFVRDKDGAQGTILAAEVCNYYKLQNKTLLHALNDIYKKYGYFYTSAVNVKFPVATYHEKVETLMSVLRAKSINKIADFNVVKKENYIDNPPVKEYRCNLIKIYLENGSWLAIRPSGTEPKLKVYLCNVGASMKELKKQNEKITEAVKNFINS